MRDALADRNLPRENKVSLVNALLADKATPATQTLVARLASHPRGRTPEEGLAEYSEIASRRRQRSVARVTTAVALTDAERSRLRAALAKLYGHDVHLQIELDPQIVGGPVVQVGDEVIDGSIVGRLTRRRANASDSQLTYRGNSRQTNENGTDGPDVRADDPPGGDPGRPRALRRVVRPLTLAAREEVGRVTEAGDGIARIEGLPSTMANELLGFEDGTLGIALNLDVREIGAVVLGPFAGIEEGQTVKRTGEILSVPVGDGFLGRVVDPLGDPIDGMGEIAVRRTAARSRCRPPRWCSASR